MAGDQILSVDDIVDDTAELEEKAAQLTGEDAVIDTEETIGTNFEMVDQSVCAILIRKQSAAGAVRVFGKEIRNVVTGPSEVGFVIVAVRSTEGETCRLLGTPSVRYFRRRPNS